MKRTLLFAALMALCVNVSAALRLPALVGDNMVLQQNTEVRVWGWTDAPGSSVTIKCDWLKKSLKTVADSENGYWEFMIATPAADHMAHSLTISEGKQSVSVKDILFGEVWFGGGQSNMEMPVQGYGWCPAKGANHEIACASAWPEVRMFFEQKNVATEPQEGFQGRWEKASPETLQNWSATGWYFAKHLNETLQVPVGMVICCWGGTRAESWMPKEDLKQWDDVDYSMLEKFDGTAANADFLSPYLMYYGMFKPVSRYTVKGIIYYQGCSNVSLHTTYASKMQKMVERWRSDFGLGEIPFYFAEIAPYNYDDSQKGMGISSALLREAQFKAQALIPNSQMISTSDLVEPYELNNIHPSDKNSVGERFSFCALNREYGYKNIGCRYPSFRSMTIEPDQIILDFNDIDGSIAVSGPLTGFEVAGEDRVFKAVPAEHIAVSSYQVFIRTDVVEKPVAVRYCFHDFQPGGGVTSQRLLPLIPFRTDNW